MYVKRHEQFEIGCGAIINKIYYYYYRHYEVAISPFFPTIFLHFMIVYFLMFAVVFALSIQK